MPLCSMQRLRAAAVLLPFAVLTGCATLQIDVDVYKGPLINNDAIQHPQVISMALSAKMLMTSARNRLLSDALGADDLGKCAPCMSRVFARDFLMKFPTVAWNPDEKDPRTKALRMAVQLNDLLAFYPDHSVPNGARLACEDGDIRNAGFAAVMDNEGIDVLARRLLAYGAHTDWEKDVQGRQLRGRVETVLIDLASRMQFLATNQWLIEEKDNELERMQALLEAVSNSILVHIDDIQSRRKHTSAGESTVAVEWKSSEQGSRGEAVKRSIDVIDQKISELKYAHIKALREGSGPEAEKIAKALVEARKQRELMIYLRPSSAYLRSVFTTTFTQPDPGLGWHNLLNDTLQRVTLRDSKEVRDIRAGLDKAYWQNINTVRVDAAGSSNFVVAKDDVGNWYVKSVGADPESMIKAATNLALYNYGGKLNTNLLRMGTLRARLDDTSLSDDERNRAGRELDALTSNGTGPAVAAHSQTIALFEKKYRRDSDAQLKKIAAAVQQDAFAVNLQRRWTESLKEGVTDAQRAAVLDVLKHSSVTSADARVKTNIQLPAGSNDTAAAVLDTLDALLAYQDAIKAQLSASAVLVATESAAATAAAGEAAAAETAMEASLTKLAEADTALAEAEAEESEEPSARKVFEAARTAARNSSTELTVKRLNARAADQALALARQRQATALKEVDLVIGQAVREEAEKRLHSVNEMETAIKLIGQSATQ